ncbi:hypothetical protein D1831_04890 [Lactiplantibacillus garii]|uniref:Uncharacterized protein n=1 Tax=Lactiplantibacillus garii TaxID=2306423 RepID=A0A426D8L1_9LACO|nr:hypothetical protein [Lactiplantibacillus garii]RRK10896.1 hypothetical protein D1831_04890 [Lactiplantibacillus garii]
MKKFSLFITTVACTLPLITGVAAPLPVTIARAAAQTTTQATMYHLTKVTVLRPQTYHVKTAVAAYQIDFTADRAAAIVNQRGRQLASNQTYVAVKAITLTTGQRDAPRRTYLQLQTPQGKVLGWVAKQELQAPVKSKARQPAAPATPKAITTTPNSQTPGFISKLATFFSELRKGLSL